MLRNLFLRSKYLYNPIIYHHNYNVKNIKFYSTHQSKPSDPPLSPTKEALISGKHDLKAANIFCCGNGCHNCAWILYLNSLEEHLKKFSKPSDELKNKLDGAEDWIKNFVYEDMKFRKVVE